MQGVREEDKLNCILCSFYPFPSYFSSFQHNTHSRWGFADFGININWLFWQTLHNKHSLALSNGEIRCFVRRLTYALASGATVRQVSFPQEEIYFLWAEIQDPQQKEMVFIVREKGFYSTHFQVPKKMEKFRPIRSTLLAIVCKLTELASGGRFVHHYWREGHLLSCWYCPESHEFSVFHVPMGTLGVLKASVWLIPEPCTFSLAWMWHFSHYCMWPGMRVLFYLNNIGCISEAKGSFSIATVA